MYHSTNKHIEVWYHHIRELIMEKRLKINKIDIELNMAECLMKLLPKEGFRALALEKRLSTSSRQKTMKANLHWKSSIRVYLDKSHDMLDTSVVASLINIVFVWADNIPIVCTLHPILIEPIVEQDVSPGAVIEVNILLVFSIGSHHEVLSLFLITSPYILKF